MTRTPSVDEILVGYMNGVFPMDVDGHVGFYSCNPRAIIPMDGFRVPRSVRRGLRDTTFEIRINSAFERIVDACGGPRHDGEWLSARLGARYIELHELGIAHSIEVWHSGHLAGGLFGIALGSLFTSESMFHRVSNAGSAALVACHKHLTLQGYTLWDIQMTSPHTERFVAIEIAEEDYLRRLAEALPR
jgi:leucyl/phenylalanyl-tRNA--protein transferase